MFQRVMIQRAPDLKAVASVYAAEACRIMTSFQGDLIYDYDLMKTMKAHAKGEWELWFWVRQSGTHAFRKGDPTKDSSLTSVAQMKEIMRETDTRAVFCVRTDGEEEFALERIQWVRGEDTFDEPQY